MKTHTHTYIHTRLMGTLHEDTHTHTHTYIHTRLMGTLHEDTHTHIYIQD